MTYRIRTYGAILLLWNGLAIECRGQTAAATIVGVVTDASGAAMAKASVELLDHSSQQLRRQPANEAGQYTFAGVLPGSYRVSASPAGLRQAAVPSLNVDVAQSYTFNFALELCAISDTVAMQYGS